MPLIEVGNGQIRFEIGGGHTGWSSRQWLKTVVCSFGENYLINVEFKNCVLVQ